MATMEDPTAAPVVQEDVPPDVPEAQEAEVAAAETRPPAEVVDDPDARKRADPQPLTDDELKRAELVLEPQVRERTTRTSDAGDSNVGWTAQQATLKTQQDAIDAGNEPTGGSGDPKIAGNEEEVEEELDYEAMTKADLVEEINNRNAGYAAEDQLSSSGTKADLIAELQEDDAAREV